ncbi:hypothetical protein [Planococcus salinus]|uniref:Uncharacterized protein n=1 Tax=Planococcus salinus TaxID=1848460 RepID=A0A3M8P587_9BACL|nr:hypothetical protein [Planococcus salinus]RNF38827.1 hypothetical protein EEX84_11940 [Planococcus salinus]
MAKVWEAVYEGRAIRVENSWFGGEKLFVDDRLVDEQVGLRFSSRLFGTVKDSEGQEKGIKVSIGSVINVHCSIFVDDRLVYSSVEQGKYK